MKQSLALFVLLLAVSCCSIVVNASDHSTVAILPDLFDLSCFLAGFFLLPFWRVRHKIPAGSILAKIKGVSRDVLPKINEATILVYTILLWFVFAVDEVTRNFIYGVAVIPSLVLMLPVGIIFNVPPSEGLFLSAVFSVLMVPTAGVAYMMLSKRIFRGNLKIVFYMWFVATLIVIGYYQLVSSLQPMVLSQFAEPKQGIGAVVDAISRAISDFMFGAAVFYLIAYCWSLRDLLASRLFPDKHTDISPALRSLIPDKSAVLVSEKFADSQTGPLFALVLSSALVGSLWLNHSVGVISDSSLVSLWIILVPSMTK